MNNTACFRKKCSPFHCVNHTIFLITLSFLVTSSVQAQSADDEITVCKIKAGDKTYILTPNELGIFEEVSNIQPLQTIPIEVTYPNGSRGQKVVIAAEDGGKLDDGRRVKPMQLDSQKRLVFNFQVSDQSGIFRLSLRKGNDTKTIRLWVGAKILFTKN